MASASDSARVSVTLCTYNGVEFITEQVVSILSQTRMPDQLIVADDGSSDGTPDLVRSIVQRARADHPDHPLDFVELSGLEPLGVVGNFERALRAADGDIVVLSDQDDVWAPDRIESALREFASHPAVSLVHGDAELIDEGGRPLDIDLFTALAVRPGELAEIDRGDAFTALVRRNLVTGATTAMRRELIDRALPVPDGWIHDEWLAIVAAAIGPTRVLRKRLIRYRQHGGNQVGAKRLTMRDRVRKLREPRQERNQHLLLRARALLTRLSALIGIDPEKVRLAADKLAHEETRSTYPAARWRRCAPVLRELSTGRYARFSLGLPDVLRDLVQPDR